MRALLVTGPPGAGKTTTLTRLMGRLEAEDVRFAAVELEALALVHPWPDDEAAFGQGWIWCSIPTPEASTRSSRRSTGA